MSFLELFKLEKDKQGIVFVFSNEKKGRKRERGEEKLQWLLEWSFRVIRLDFFLCFRQIRLSEVVETRRKAALRIETYVWAPVSGVFDKLRELGISPYLGSTLYLSVLQCFGWFEALNDRLNGSKSWNRSVGILRPTDHPY